MAMQFVPGVCRYDCGRVGTRYRNTMCHACYERDRRRCGGRFPAEHLFFARIFGEDQNGCWMWGGASRKDYGVFYYKNEIVAAHRWSYEFFRHEIPAGLVIDHLCRNPACVNPWHMEPVTLAENTLRGIGPSAQNARKDHCVNGHSMHDAIVLAKGPQKGRRGCRTCMKERWAAKATDPEFRAARAAHERARRAQKKAAA